MGSTGRGSYASSRNQGSASTETFGIKGAVAYRGAVPAGSGLAKPSADNVTLKARADDGPSIVFQFKLSRDLRFMTITAFKDSVPAIKCRVSVDSGSPSLDRVIATGSRQQKLEAVKMKDLFSKSVDVSENQLASIANELKQERASRRS